MDAYGIDAISIGGVISWLMECLIDGLLTPEELGVEGVPVFSPENFDVVKDSKHNAPIGVQMIVQIILPDGKINLLLGARMLARNLAREMGVGIMDRFVHIGFARKGWVVPNQYCSPEVLVPHGIHGKILYELWHGFLDSQRT